MDAKLGVPTRRHDAPAVATAAATPL